MSKNNDKKIGNSTNEIKETDKAETTKKKSIFSIFKRKQSTKEIIKEAQNEAIKKTEEEEQVIKHKFDENLKFNDDAYVSLRHIDKIYDNNVQAVFDFNLDVEQHEFIVLVGPSVICGYKA